MSLYDKAVKWKSNTVSPRPKHIPDDATPTSIALTGEDRSAILWLKLLREGRGDDRKTINDILVDGLWTLIEKEGKSRDEIRAMLPPRPRIDAKDKITEIPKKKA